MGKKAYIKPQTKKVFLAIEQLMIIASPGVGGEYKPGTPIGSKGSNFFDEEEDEQTEQEGYASPWQN